MENPDAVQPIDNYVRNILEYVVKKHGVKIDLDRPTRAQRLEAALAIQNESNGWSSMEIMVGKRVGSNDSFAMTWTVLKMAEDMGTPNPQRLYGGFAHQYFPKETETEI